MLLFLLSSDFSPAFFADAAAGVFVAAADIAVVVIVDGLTPPAMLPTPLHRGK